MTYTQIQDAVYSWLVSFINTPIIWSEQAINQPQNTFLVLKLENNPFFKRGYDDIIYASGSFKVTGSRFFKLTITGYGKDSFDTAAQIQTLSQVEENNTLLRQNNIAINGIPVIINLTDFLSVNFEKRFLVEIDLAVYSTHTLSTVNIEKVELTETYNGVEYPPYIIGV